MAPLAQLDGRCPLVKLSQESGFDLLKLLLNPLLVFVGQHGLIIALYSRISMPSAAARTLG